MHAYAGDDPIFLAMNERGQRETNGALGDFCVRCHAPIAVREGYTSDGLNLHELPQHLKGVTCFFCHSVEAVEGEHNNPLVLATDLVLRGGIRDPIENGAHRTKYSNLLDRNKLESSRLCGSCHDIVTPAGVHIERTFSEWKTSVFAKAGPGSLSCGKCHMIGDRPGPIADFEGAPIRKPKDHSFPGVDIALIPWPQKEAQLTGIKRDLFGAVIPQICVDPSFEVEIILENVLGGHSLPSGAGLDRRMWVEVLGYNKSELVFSSGVVPEGQAVAELPDPDLWQIRDYGFDQDDQVAHMFWDVMRYESELLPVAVTNDLSDPRYVHSVNKKYQLPIVDTVSVRVHLRPIGLEILDDLIDSGDLNSIYRDLIPTYTFEGAVLEWTREDGFDCITR